MEIRTYQDVLRENLRRARLERGLSQDVLAAQARSIGMSWAQQTVADVETGRHSVSLGEAWLLPGLLGVSLGELLATDEVVDVEGIAVAPDELRRLVAGEVLRPTPADYAEMTDDQLVEVYGQFALDVLAAYGLQPDAFTLADIWAASWGDAEKKAARGFTKELGRRVEPLEVAVAAHALWGRGLTEQREVLMAERAAADDTQRAAQAKRGHVTRQLLDELRKRIEGKRRRGRKQ